MATKIRLQRGGRKSYAFYSIVIADVRAPRDGKFTEKIGTFNPNTNPATVDLNFERALYWVETGAQPTDTVRNILKGEGVYLMKHLKGGVKKGEALEGIVLTIAAKVSATGQLYGSVNAATVAEELAKKGIEVDRKIITMKDAKKVGEYEATVHYHKEVEVKVPVNVVAENAPVAAPAAEEVAAEAVAEEEAPAAE